MRIANLFRLRVAPAKVTDTVPVAPAQTALPADPPQSPVEKSADPPQSPVEQKRTDGPPLEFDEQAYLEANPDVANAVAQKAIASGWSHYQHHGKKENRPLKRTPADTVDPLLPDLRTRHRDAAFLVPTDLTVTTITPRRIALIGSCLLESWRFHKNDGSIPCPADLIVVGNAGKLPQVDVSQYDFLVLQISLRSIMPDHTLWHIPYKSHEKYERAFDEVCERLRFQVVSRMAWNQSHGLLTFVANFFVPQNNPFGRLFPRYDLRNPEYFVDRLNEELEKIVRGHKNAYVLDIDRIASSQGRRYMQDDSLVMFSHNALLPLPGLITTRMEPLAPMSEHYVVQCDNFREAVWNEVIGLYRTVRQVDPVKLVVCDLDDVMWDGVSGDLDEIGPEMVEGWPIGLVESLTYLKQRGVLIAIISKNEESRIREIWPKIFLNRLRLEDFASVCINWQSKAANMAEMLRLINLLPKNVVFIDDNPVERDAMKQAFPEMRVLGRHPYYLRRILLWSPETQVAVLTDESARRTEMVQRQLERESVRETLSREQFLAAAAPSVRLFEVTPDHPRFSRVLELINKTNQFNTTGRRWSVSELTATKWRMFAFEVEDSYTQYGLVGVVLASEDTIEQWVMSCRVLGYDIENAVMKEITAQLGKPIRGRLIETEVNFPCRDLFQKCGFDPPQTGDMWTLRVDRTLVTPPHVKMEID